MTIGYPASLGRRIGAMCYDALLLIGVWMLTLLALVLFNGGESVTGLWVQLVLVAEMVGFFLYAWLRQGQTLGMLAWRIKLTDESGAKANVKQMLIRLVVAPLSMCVFFLGYLWMMVDRNKQTWHDKLSHTTIVYLPKEA